MSSTWALSSLNLRMLTTDFFLDLDIVRALSMVEEAK